MCKAKDCNKKARTGSYCPGHYDRLRRNGDLAENKPLVIRGIPHMDAQGYMRYTKNKKKIWRHREVMEEHIGRRLFPHEKIHHLNGNRSDNRIENLEIWSSIQPSGQRIEDKVKWALEILEIYKDFNPQQKEASYETHSKTG